jgi:hypothetical protein
VIVVPAVFLAMHNIVGQKEFSGIQQKLIQGPQDDGFENKVILNSFSKTYQNLGKLFVRISTKHI